MKARGLASAAGAALLALGAAGAATAGGPGPTSGLVGASVLDVADNQSVTQDISGQPSGGELLVSSTGSIAGSDVQFAPSLFATSSARTNKSPIGPFLDNTASAQTMMQYGLEIQGPASALVPVNIAALLSTGGGIGDSVFAGPQSFSASADLSVSGTGLSVQWLTCASAAFSSANLCDPGVDSLLNIDQTLNLQSNTVYTISEGTVVAAAEGGDAEAYAQQFFSIETGFAEDNPEYTLIVSDGVANIMPPSGAPEPATWVMMLVGFGGLGAAMRARRRSVAATA